MDSSQYWSVSPVEQRLAETSKGLVEYADVGIGQPHAEWARQSISGAALISLHACGHLIWLGHDSERMRTLRSEFIRRQGSQSRQIHSASMAARFMLRFC